jgi:hypothetical protein
MTTQLTVEEIIRIINHDCWYMDYFLNNQIEVTERINAKLRGEAVDFQGDIEQNIYSWVDRKVTADAKELEQTIRYAGVEPHIANKIEIGAILVSSWGYEQTNVDFYCVVEMTAKMVKMLPLKKVTRQSEGYSSMAGKATAAQEVNFRENILKKKIQPDNWVRIESYSHAHVWDGKQQYESWYA